MQWMDVILTAVQWVVSVWCQRTPRGQRRGGWTWGAWSASVTSISTTGRTTYHVFIIKHFLHSKYICMSVSVLGVIWLKRYFIYCKKYLFSGFVTTHFEKLRTLKKKFKVRLIWDQVNALWKKYIYFFKVR